MKGKNIASMFIEKAKEIGREQDIFNIRIDTHELNHSMQKTLKKNGFIKCGNITIQNNEPRVAFQKMI